MRKVFLILVLLSAFLISCSKKKNESDLSEFTGRWSLEIESSELKLKEDGNYSLGHPMWDGFFAYGTWNIDENKIIHINYPNEIHISDKADYKQKVLDYLFPEGKSTDFTYDENYKTFNFYGCLRSGEIILVDPYTRESPTNQEYQLDGTTVVKLERSFIVSTENMKLRNAPFLDAQEEKFSYSISGIILGKTNLLIKNYPAEVDAVTVERTEVDGISSPWYRIILSGGDEDYGHVFWIWGGYSKYYENMEKESLLLHENRELIINECRRLGLIE